MLHRRLISGQFGLGIQNGALNFENLVRQTLSCVVKGNDVRLVFQVCELLFRIVELHTQGGSFPTEGVAILPRRRMNFVMSLEIVINDFLKDGLNDPRVGVLERDHNDTAAFGGRFPLQIVPDKGRGIDGIAAASGPGQDVSRSNVGNGLFRHVQAGQNLDFRIDDVIPSRIGQDHILVTPHQGQGPRLRHVLDQQLRLGLVRRGFEEVESEGGQNASQGKENDFPLVAKHHIVDVAQGHSRRLLSLSAIIHLCPNLIVSQKRKKATIIFFRRNADTAPHRLGATAQSAAR